MRNATDSTAPLTQGHRLRIALAVISCALSLAACGSSNNPSSGTSSGSFVRFAVCMRSHGVPNFPDSLSSGPGGAISLIPPGVNTASPAFKTAFVVCDKFLPSLHQHQHASAQAMNQVLKFSECMRAHGVTGFPDPTPTPPANFGGDSMVVRHGGAYLAIPDTIKRASPIYKQATTACHFGPVFSQNGAATPERSRRRPRVAGDRASESTNPVHPGGRRGRA